MIGFEPYTALGLADVVAHEADHDFGLLGKPADDQNHRSLEPCRVELLLRLRPVPAVGAENRGIARDDELPGRSRETRQVPDVRHRHHEKAVELFSHEAFSQGGDPASDGHVQPSGRGTESAAGGTTFRASTPFRAVARPRSRPTAFTASRYPSPPNPQIIPSVASARTEV